MDDVQALEHMLNMNLLESGVTRIGAEQEFCTMDYHQRPLMISSQMLDQLQDGRFTTELAKFNLEANLTPLELKGRCFSNLERELIYLLTCANKAAHGLGGKIILTGIVPTIRQSDLVIENMTEKDRYHQLNKALLDARGSHFKFHIHGEDELIHTHDSVLFESCNTSFQVHYQLQQTDALDRYNWSQFIAAPVLAAAVNSPFFMGKRLWSETRIALFQQSTDTRKSSNPLRKEVSRVHFGNGWLTGEIIDIYREITSRFPVLLPLEIEETSTSALEKGSIPKLKALGTHNGTVYRWNRLCYGTTEGKPHLRIENRYLPSGPTIVDEVANAAFWTGLMHGMPGNAAQLVASHSFEDVRSNFFTCAKNGLNAQITWQGARAVPVGQIILNELLPMADKGLKLAGVHATDRSKYLGIIRERVESGITGSSWMRDAYKKLKSSGVRDDAVMVSITEGIYQRQKTGTPVSQWSEINAAEGDSWESKYKYVSQIMTGDLITVQEDDLIELALNILQWSNIHNLPVEDKSGRLIGLISSDNVLRTLVEKRWDGISGKVVGDLMLRDVPTISPDALSTEVYNYMMQSELDCLPVVQHDQLVGIVTRQDFAHLLGFFIHSTS